LNELNTERELLAKVAWCIGWLGSVMAMSDV